MKNIMKTNLITALMYLTMGMSILSLPAADKATTRETSVVVAEGVGINADKALLKTLRNAVRQVVGAIIDAETLIKNNKVVKDQILDSSDGFVEKFEKIKEGKNKDGLYEMTIKAVVKHRQLVEKLKQAKVYSVGVGRVKTRDDVIRDIEAGKPITLPENYGSSVAFKQPTAQVIISKIEMKAGQVPKGLDKGLGRFLETKLYGLKRFDIWLTQSEAFKRAVESGLIDPPPAKDPPKIGLLFDCKLFVSKRAFERADGTDRVIYIVDALLSIMDSNKRHIGLPIEVTRKTQEMKIILGSTGKRIGGVTLEKETQAIRNAIFECFTQFNARLVDQFPVTAQVTSISPRFQRMLLDKGYEQGLVREQQMVFWVRVDGLDIPIGYGEALPLENTSRIKILAWQKGADYEEFVRGIMTPGWLKKEGNKLFATTVGLAPPPEWVHPESPPKK